MINSLKTRLSRNINNSRGWKTGRKIVVIESDDWGGIRMPNLKAYNDLLGKGIRVDLCPYNKYDTLANAEDFDALFSVLSKHCDFRMNNPIITFNTNVVNPDFIKIKRENFEEYFFEDFTTTLNRYYPNENVFDLWKEGINNKFIFPQFHGREHINPEIWLELLKNGQKDFRDAFNNNLCGLSFVTSKEIKLPYLASLIYQSEGQKENVKTSIVEGSEIFNRIFGFRSKSFIAPVYTWSSELEETFHKAGIKYIQGSNSHKDYDFAKGSNNHIRHVMGDSNEFEQIYLHRNCSFEPSIYNQRDNVDNCLKEIENAFLWGKPAVISMHRLNFIGVLNEENRKKNLKDLDLLLHNILNRWKNVEFMHTSMLGDIISNK